MLKYAQGYVKINGINIHYYRTGGNKPPFILLHGVSDNGLCWTPVAELLAKQYDVIMPDAQGHGLSDRIDRNFTYTNHAQQIVGLLQELGISKPVLLGHSMGAGTAAMVAAEYPKLPRAIILEDPAWDKLAILSPERDNKDEINQANIIVRHLTEAVKRTREELINECRQANPCWSEAEIVPWAESKLQFDPAIFSAAHFDRYSYMKLVPLIKCPVLLIISDGGITTPEVAEQAKKLWRSEQAFRWVQIKGAGHNIRREQFKAFCEALTDFLKILPK
jgi:N-formylmaleamate deformylase